MRNQVHSASAKGQVVFEQVLCSQRQGHHRHSPSTRAGGRPVARRRRPRGQGDRAAGGHRYYRRSRQPTGQCVGGCGGDGGIRSFGRCPHPRGDDRDSRPGYRGMARVATTEAQTGKHPRVEQRGRNGRPGRAARKRHRPSRAAKSAGQNRVAAPRTIRPPRRPHNEPPTPPC